MPLIITIDDMFWTGSRTSSEYPNVQKFKFANQAVAMAKSLELTSLYEAADIEVIRNYGFEDETVIWTNKK